MPIPFIIWGLAAAGAGYLLWKYRAEIRAWLNSEEGKEFIRKLNQATEGYLAPYQKMLDECLVLETKKRRIYLEEVKADMTDSSWGMFVSFAKQKARTEPKYYSVLTDIEYTDKNK